MNLSAITRSPYTQKSLAFGQTEPTRKTITLGKGKTVSEELYTSTRKALKALDYATPLGSAVIQGPVATIYFLSEEFEGPVQVNYPYHGKHLNLFVQHGLLNAEGQFANELVPNIILDAVSPQKQFRLSPARA